MSLPLNHFLQVMIDKKGSDLFVSSQLPVSAKVNGELIPLSDEKLSDEDSLALVESAMNDKQRKEFHDSKECNFAIATDEGRFRVSAFWQHAWAHTLFLYIHIANCRDICDGSICVRRCYADCTV